MLLAAVGELGIDLIGKHENIGAAENVRDSLEVFLLHNTAGGVVGEGQQHGLGLRRDGGLQSLGCELELILLSGDDVDGNAAGEDDAGVVGNVGGLGDDDLIAGGDKSADGKVDRLACADGNEDLALRLIMNAVALVKILADELTQLGHSAVGGVRDAAVGKALQSLLPDGFGRGKIGLAYAEADGLVGKDIEVLADTGRRYVLNGLDDELGVIHG